MKQRIIIGVLLIAVISSGFLFKPLVFLPVTLLTLLGLVAVHELAAMFRDRHAVICVPVASLCVLLLVVVATRGRIVLAGHVVALSACGAFLWRMRNEGVEGAWSDVSATVAACVYIGLPVAFLVELFVETDQSRNWLLLLLLVVWTTDSLAYFVGKSIGSVKIFPVLSPGKTWEGSLGGVAGSMIPAALLVLLIPSTFGPVSSVELVLLCLVTGVAVQAGDLAESLLKRAANVKDSGGILGAHGGALDRLDSLLFAVVPFSLYLHIAHPEIFIK